MHPNQLAIALLARYANVNMLLLQALGGIVILNDESDNSDNDNINSATHHNINSFFHYADTTSSHNGIVDEKDDPFIENR